MGRHDIPIPAPVTWVALAAEARAEAEQAPRVGRLDRDDIEAAVRGRCGTGCVGDCHQGRERREFAPSPDMSMCDPDTLTPRDKPKARMGDVFPLERWFLRHPTATTVGVIVVLLVLWGLAGAGDLPPEVVR